MNGEQPPSAPLEEERHVTAPAPQTNPAYPTLNSPPTYGSTNEYYQPPPPTYQDALNYPQFNHPPASMPKLYTPQTEVPVNGAYPQPNSSVYAGAPLGAPPPQVYHTPQPTVVHTIISTSHPPAGNCMWCRNGNVQNETDLCCLICLILLAICTFPFGLVLLCCIPCTVRPRCTNCRRLQD